MTRQRTSAEIEAGAEAIYNLAPCVYGGLSDTFETILDGDRADLLEMSSAALSAADAAAAPAVGVTVDELEAMLDLYFINRFESIMADGQHLAVGFLEQAEAEKARIIALLTAQPGDAPDAGAGED